MAPLKDVSIKRKLMSIILLTCGTVLLVAAAAFVTFEIIALLRSMTNDLRALADITGENSNGAMSFHDQSDAQRILGALRAKPHISAAYLFRKDGSVFARYPEGAPARTLDTTAWKRDYRFREARLEMLRPVLLDGDEIGSVVIQSDLTEVWDRFQQYLGVAVLVVGITMSLAWFLSSRLQRLISLPIRRLAETTREVSHRQNYAVRALKESEDEIGQFIDAFNLMLTQIEERDAALQTARDELEIRVTERTQELEQEIAERKETEEKLKELAAKLERSNRELQAFAYVASHDLQEPLRKVQAFGDRLRTKCHDGLGTEGQDYVDRMQNAARRMQNLIDDLLLFSRVSTQTQPFRKVDLNQVAREVLNDLEIRLQQTQGTVELDSLPALDADPIQMRQLFQNLFSNALKFHRPGVPPHVRVTGAIIQAETGLPDPLLHGHACRITVEDNGIGFDEKYADRMFAVFQRLHGRSYEGTGIGLAICRKIVERHDGKISARSLPGQGAAFTVLLPLKR